MAPLSSKSQFSGMKNIQGDFLCLLRATDAHLLRSVLTEFNSCRFICFIFCVYLFYDVVCLTSLKSTVLIMMHSGSRGLVCSLKILKEKREYEVANSKSKQMWTVKVIFFLQSMQEKSWGYCKAQLQKKQRPKEKQCRHKGYTHLYTEYCRNLSLFYPTNQTTTDIRSNKDAQRPSYRTG